MGPVGYFHWRDTFLDRAVALCATLNAPKTKERILFLRKADVPLLLDPEGEEDFTGRAILFKDGSLAKLASLAAQAQFQSNGEEGGARFQHPLSLSSVEEWIRQGARELAYVILGQVVLLAERGMLDRPVPKLEPALARAIAAYRVAGERGLLAQATAEITTGRLNLGLGEPGQALLVEEWRDWRLVEKFERLRQKSFNERRGT